MEGQCKIEFEKWMKPNPLEHGRYGQLITNTFDNMPLSFQWGVIVDFFDSVGIRIQIIVTTIDFRFKIDTYTLRVDFKTRTEAREKAIEKATQIFNQSENKVKEIL